MTLRRAGLLLALCLFLLPGTAGAQTFGKNKIQYRTFHWQVLQSPHFEVYYYEGGRRLAEDVVAIAERASVKLSRDLDHRLSKRVPILVYNSHNDFSQTNLTDEIMDESVGGFTEALKNRVVIPFSGSYEELRHVVVHELTHAYMFDILYGGSLTSFFGSSNFFNVPLWLAEGLAEWESLGMEPGAEQFLRDGIIHDYIVPLPYEPGGYLVYKQGQSVMQFIHRRYGREKFAELVRRLRTFRGADRAVERTLGVSVKKLSEDWIKDLKKQYWPQVAVLDDPEKFARRLTDHAKDGSNLNTSPAISPDGSKIAYLSDRRVYTDLYVMSALDGKVLKRLVRASQSRQFENIPSFRSSLAWSPDNSRLAFVAKSSGRDVIYFYDLERDEVAREIRLDLDGVSYPAFSPDGRTLAFEGLKDGRNDIYFVDLEGGALRRVTDDDFDEKDLVYAPDCSLTFSSDRHGPLDLAASHTAGGAGTYGIYSLEPASGRVREVLFTGHDDAQPAWSPDGRALAFVTQRDHGQDLYVFRGSDSTVTRVTRLIGGIYNLSWSRTGDRLVFSALNKGGWDVFCSREPLDADSVLAHTRASGPGQGFTFAEFARREEAPAAGLPGSPAAGTVAAVTAPMPALAGGSPVPAAPDTAGWSPGVADSSAPAAAASGSPATPVAAAPADSEARRLAAVAPGAVAVSGPPPGPPGNLAAGDTLGFPRVRVTREDSLAAEAAADSASRLVAQPYRTRFSADFLSGGFAYNSLVGFGGGAQVAVSDFLGNDRFFLATDLFTSSLDETNFLALYNYLPRRADLAVGLFHFKNYYFSRVNSLGEQTSDPRYFSERSYGVLGQVSYPFSKFRRVDFDLSVQVMKRDNLVTDSSGYYLVQVSDTTNVLAAPSVSLVWDNTLDGWFGPIDGSRWMASATRAFPIGSRSLSFTTLSVDYRRYFHLGSGYSLAFRALGIGSYGSNPQPSFLGGATTLRGYDNISNNTDQRVSVMSGRKAVLTSLEFRFPFIRHLGFSAPLPISFFNIEGVLFADAGAAWNDGLRILSNEDGLHFVDPRASYGVGVRAAVAYFLMHLDVAWPTQATLTNPDKKPRWHFSIGPEF
ncbi:MAG: PD40 domain-containing protein [Candidatus Eisenbacteria bacterium]|nr:PD40 domain-containing protein [Candidatus Eisenbacteria bacterium]